LTGIAASLLEEFADAGADSFGLNALDDVLELERERNRRFVRLAAEELMIIAHEPDSWTFDLNFAALLEAQVLDAVAGGTCPQAEIRVPRPRRIEAGIPASIGGAG